MNRHPQPGPRRARTRRKPLAETIDDTADWVALGQLLLALGLRRETICELPRVQELGDKLERLTEDVTKVAEGAGAPGDFRALDGSDQPIGASTSASELLAAWSRTSEDQRDEFETALMEMIGIVTPVVRGVMTALRKKGIRSEIVGVSSQGVMTLLTKIEGTVTDGRLFLADLGYLAALLENAMSRDARGRSGEFEALFTGPTIVTDPVKPKGREVRRLVKVLRRIPRQTLLRYIPVRNPLLLGIGIRVRLKHLREDFSAEMPEDQKTQFLRTLDKRDASRARRNDAALDPKLRAKLQETDERIEQGMRSTAGRAWDR